MTRIPLHSNLATLSLKSPIANTLPIGARATYPCIVLTDVGVTQPGQWRSDIDSVETLPTKASSHTTTDFQKEQTAPVKTSEEWG